MNCMWWMLKMHRSTFFPPLSISDEVESRLEKNRRINVNTFYGAPNNSVITAVNHHLGGHYGFSRVERVRATMDPVCFMRKLLSPRSHTDAETWNIYIIETCAWAARTTLKATMVCWPTRTTGWVHSNRLFFFHHICQTYLITQHWNISSTSVYMCVRVRVFCCIFFSPMVAMHLTTVPLYKLEVDAV